MSLESRMSVHRSPPVSKPLNRNYGLHITVVEAGINPRSLQLLKVSGFPNSFTLLPTHLLSD